MLISESQILEVLRRQNTWWAGNIVPEDLALPFRRLSFFEIQSFLSVPALKRAVVLTGARRVGKTVLLHQIADDALKHGLPAKAILYVTFEDLTLTQANLREIISLYEKNVRVIDGKTLILLDEIHYTAEWGRWLMTIMREFPKARIIATGSAAVLLRHKQSESAAGRWVSVHVPTLSFYEYIHLRKVAAPNLEANFSILDLGKRSPKEREEILGACLPLESELGRYLLQGGFPAIAEKPDLGMAQRLLREDVVDKALKRDMAHLYGARSLGQLDQIFAYLCFNMGGIVEKNTLAKELGVAAMTVENHLQRLEDAHLIYRLPPFDISGKKYLKPRPKIYVADPSLRNAVLLRGDGLLTDEVELGHVVEGCVFKHLYAFYYPERPRFGYWKNSSDREVDFLLIFPNGDELACEVKYRENPTLHFKDGLMQIIEGPRRPKWSLLVTKKSIDFGPIQNGKVLQIPAFLFCYLLGHVEYNRWTKGHS